jgi:cobalt-zinc-cadmium efflux system outer membrane protein
VEGFHEIKQSVYGNMLSDGIAISGHAITKLYLIHTRFFIPGSASDDFRPALSNGATSYSNHSTVIEVRSDLTLRDIINLALLRNPELAAFAEMRALEG